jgi:hypothetical protein
LSNDLDEVLQHINNEVTAHRAIEKYLDQTADLLKTLNDIPDFEMPTLPPPSLQDTVHTPPHLEVTEAQEFCQDLAREGNQLRLQVGESKQVVMYVSSPTGPVRVVSLGFRNPNLVIFRGERTEVVSHVQAAQASLVVVDRDPKQPAAKEPMGFRYVGSVEKQSQ